MRVIFISFLASHVLIINREPPLIFDKKFNKWIIDVPEEWDGLVNCTVKHLDIFKVKIKNKFIPNFVKRNFYNLIYRISSNLTATSNLTVIFSGG